MIRTDLRLHFPQPAAGPGPAALDQWAGSAPEPLPDPRRLFAGMGIYPEPSPAFPELERLVQSDPAAARAAVAWMVREKRGARLDLRRLQSLVHESAQRPVWKRLFGPELKSLATVITEDHEGRLEGHDRIRLLQSLMRTYPELVASEVIKEQLLTGLGAELETSNTASQATEEVWAAQPQMVGPYLSGLISRHREGQRAHPQLFVRAVVHHGWKPDPEQARWLAARLAIPGPELQSFARAAAELGTFDARPALESLLREPLERLTVTRYNLFGSCELVHSDPALTESLVATVEQGLRGVPRLEDAPLGVLSRLGVLDPDRLAPDPRRRLLAAVAPLLEPAAGSQPCQWLQLRYAVSQREAEIEEAADRLSGLAEGARLRRAVALLETCQSLPHSRRERSMGIVADRFEATAPRPDEAAAELLAQPHALPLLERLSRRDPGVLGQLEAALGEGVLERAEGFRGQALESLRGSLFARDLEELRRAPEAARVERCLILAGAGLREGTLPAHQRLIEAWSDGAAAARAGLPGLEVLVRDPKGLESLRALPGIQERLTAFDGLRAQLGDASLEDAARAYNWIEQSEDKGKALKQVLTQFAVGRGPWEEPQAPSTVAIRPDSVTVGGVRLARRRQ